MLLCLRSTGQNRSASYWGKYNVTYDMFPPSYYYPHYCNGQCALINRQALMAIHKETLRTAMGDFRIEDIYFTGILREKANITNIQEFISTVFTLEGKFGNPRQVTGSTCMHDTKENKFPSRPFIKEEKWIVPEHSYDYKLTTLKETKIMMAEKNFQLG